jgi:hypothetical protein
MKTIKIPAPVVVPSISGETGEPISFSAFLFVAIDQHNPFGKGIQGIRQANKIAAAIESANGELVLEDADFAALKQAVETAQFNPRVARHVVAFFEAFHQRSDENPAA